MNKSMLAALTEQERLLVAETERAQLSSLDEEQVLALHDRIRRARNKYTGQYRRTASARVAAEGGRGIARPKNQRAALKAEAFEEALARVSRRLAALSAATAGELRTERLAAARATAGSPSAARPPAAGAASSTSGRRRSVTDRPRGDRSLKSPASTKRKASTQAAGARRQAKRDSR